METQSTTSIVADTQEPRDFGQAIAVEYWRATPHVWSHQGKDKPCGLCLALVNTLHREAEPYGPQPTFTSVGGSGNHYLAELSCGHGPIGTGGMLHRPDVGEPYDCMTCRMDVDARNHPGLPDEVRERIESLLPKCPQCGGAIDKIPFIKRTNHTYEASVDWQTGQIDASSDHYDTLEEDPDWTIRRYVQGQPVRELEVECAEGHSWFETRLSHRQRDGEHIWTVAPAPSAAIESDDQVAALSTAGAVS